VTKKELKNLIAAALSGGGRNGGGAQRKNDDKSGKSARDSEDKDKLRRGNRLPEGQKCSEGFCDFAHDKLKPNEPCWRNPNWEGPLPLRVHNDERQRERIVKQREEVAAKLGKTAKPLKPPAPADGAASVSLVDLLQGTYMTLDDAIATEGIDQLDLGDLLRDAAQNGACTIKKNEQQVSKRGGGRPGVRARSKRDVYHNEEGATSEKRGRDDRGLAGERPGAGGPETERASRPR
jgi:hypothetical protein